MTVSDFINFIIRHWYIIIIVLVFLYLFKHFADIFWTGIKEKNRIKKENKMKASEDAKRKAEEEQQMHAHRVVSMNNWLLNEITKTRIIIIKGLAGKGKTILMQVFTKFLVDKFNYELRKNRRYYKIMNPSYLERREKLSQDGFLPVYTNMHNVFDITNGLKAQESALDILQQKIKANSPAVVQFDEFGSVLSKFLIFEIMAEKDKSKIKDNNELKDLARKLRHYGLWLIGTEQDGDDIVKWIRQFGYACPEALQTNVSVLPFGQRKQKRQIFIKKWSMGLFVSKIKNRFAECMDFPEKVKTFFKMFMPAHKGFEKQFYVTRNEIYKKINERYTVFKTLMNYEGKLYWLYYGNHNKLSYDTLAFSGDYDNKFTSDGTRKKYV